MSEGARFLIVLTSLCQSVRYRLAYKISPILRESLQGEVAQVAGWPGAVRYARCGAP
jgi:hypothetical protein